MNEWQDYHVYRQRQTNNDGSRHTVVGTLKVLPGFSSPELANRRDILVYLPPSYQNGDSRYPVLYMHDGQNLFDDATSYAGEWQVDETINLLSTEGIEAIVVGLPNMGGERFDEYSPFHEPGLRDGRGRRYVDFIADTVKPEVDRAFRTRPGREDTGIMGSSLGGLISLYAFFYRPDTFGLTGVMSPSLWVANRAIFAYITEAPFVAGKIYLDAGTRELAGSRQDKRRRENSRRYYAAVRRMQRILYKKGYRPRHDLFYIEEKWAHHREAAWARRLPQALRFLLQK